VLLAQRAQHAALGVRERVGRDQVVDALVADVQLRPELADLLAQGFDFVEHQVVLASQLVTELSCTLKLISI